MTPAIASGLELRQRQGDGQSDEEEHLEDEPRAATISIESLFD